MSALPRRRAGRSLGSSPTSRSRPSRPSRSRSRTGVSRRPRRALLTITLVGTFTVPALAPGASTTDPVVDLPHRDLHRNRRPHQRRRGIGREEQQREPRQHLSARSDTGEHRRRRRMRRSRAVTEAELQSRICGASSTSWASSARSRRGRPLVLADGWLARSSPLGLRSGARRHVRRQRALSPLPWKSAAGGFGRGGSTTR